MLFSLKSKEHAHEINIYSRMKLNNLQVIETGLYRPWHSRV